MGKLQKHWSENQQNIQLTFVCMQTGQKYLSQDGQILKLGWKQKQQTVLLDLDFNKNNPFINQKAFCIIFYVLTTRKTKQFCKFNLEFF